MSPESTLLLAAAGRILIGGVFVFAGVRNIMAFGGLSGLIAGRGVPMPKLLLAAAIALQIVAGCLVILDIATGWAALALIAFLVPATVIFHNFWDHAGPDRVNRINGVASNVALAGGFLLMMALGQ